jgi:hypothetical protein
MAPVSLDPTQRIVDISFGNRIAIVYADAGRPNAVIPPQLVLSLTAPVSFALINGDAVLSATGLGLSSPPIGTEIAREMLQAYRAWRYQSVEVYSTGHAELVGIQNAIALNLAKFTGPRIDLILTAVGIGENFSRADVAISTYRGLGGLTFPSEGSGNVFTDAPPIGIAAARRSTPGSITGSIDLETLAVTLVSDGTSGGGGGNEN